MRCVPCLLLSIFAFAGLAYAEPPTVSRETTYYLEPLDAEGYVDYIAALNAAFGDADAKPATNAFLGILDQLETSDWPDGHIPALYAALGAEPPSADQPRFVPFMVYAETQSIPQAPVFDWENAPPDAEPPPPPPGTADAMEERGYGAPWTAEELPEVADWLDTVEGPLDAIVQAIHRPNYYAPLVRPHPDATMIEVLLPHLGSHRAVARSLNMRLRRHLGESNFNAAIADWAAMKRLAQLQQHEPILISNLVGISIHAMAHDAFTLIVSQPGLTAEQLAEMRRVMDHLPAGVDIAKVIQDGERVIGLDLLILAAQGRVQVLETIDLIQSLMQSDEPPTYFVNDRGPEPLTKLISDPRFDLDRALRRVNAGWDEWFGQVPDDYAAMAAHQEQVEDLVQQRFNEAELNMPNLLTLGQTGIPPSADPQLIADQTADLILSILAPALGSAARIEAQSKTQRSLEPVALALAAYRLDQRQYPPLLQSLIPAYLSELPADLLGDKSLRYRKQGPGYLLYSVGTNLTDDGGVQDFREGDIVLAVPATP